MRRILLLFLVTSCLILSHQAQAQCDYQFSHEVKVIRKDTSYELKLTLVKGEESQNYRVVLYDLRSNKAVEEKHLLFVRNKPLIAFTGLKSSIYTVYIFYPNCEEPISLGGAKGIKTSGL
jgi:hypothetical protein